MAGLGPATHDLDGPGMGKSWVAGPRPAMTRGERPAMALKLPPPPILAPMGRRPSSAGTPSRDAGPGQPLARVLARPCLTCVARLPRSRHEPRALHPLLTIHWYSVHRGGGRIASDRRPGNRTGSKGRRHAGASSTFATGSNR